MMNLANKTQQQNDISTRAMLVTLNISTWSGRKADKQIKNEAATKHNANADMIAASKYLIDRAVLKPVNERASAARQDHYKLTLPWQQSGSNILSSAGYFEYARIMREHDQEFFKAVDQVVREYHRAQQRAEQQLGSLYDPADYPADIRSKYAFSFDVAPLPVANDFRVDLGNAELARVKSEIERSTKNALDQAMKSAWQRVFDVVSHMKERLALYSPSQPGTAPFRDSLVENISELLALLPALNITGDQALENIAKQMKSDLTVFSPDQLRTDDAARDQTLDRAKQILDQVSAYI